ncbi:MerR family transcriptional regulator [Streptomyces albus subsp. albus]|nr:MerR family transcriptional regulator [Streptomyces albus subsp. albus]
MLGRVNDDLLSIGTFARLVRLSVKQLRRYADLGLLAPAWVDPASGYRYYRREQARDALSIGLLRSLDVPLAAMAEVLGGPDAGGVLAEVRDRLDDELARRRRALATLEHILAHGLPSAEITLVREQPQRVAVAREVAAAPHEVGPATARCVARLLPALRPPARLTGLFPVELDEYVPVAVAATLPEGRAAPNGVVTELLAGGVFACATHSGPYDQISLTAHAVLAWCTERGHATTGPIREVYLTDPADTPPEQQVTRLMIPLEETA